MSLLSEIQPEACSGLHARLLHQQAQAQMHQQQHDNALRCLDKALIWEPYDINCLLLKALVSFASCQQALEGVCTLCATATCGTELKGIKGLHAHV